jgi:hypothetical protein
MPSMYSEGEYALAGFSVGVVLPCRADKSSWPKSCPRVRHQQATSQKKRERKREREKREIKGVG